MKLLTINKRGRNSLGVKVDQGIIDIEDTLCNNKKNYITTDIMELIRAGEETIKQLEDHITQLEDSEISYLSEDGELEWGPCITNPSKIICVGLNYRRHADETGSKYPDSPILFSKFNNTLAGNHSLITIPKTTEEVDFEVELGIVIGRRAKEVSKDEALKYVFGYCTANDLSARDLQFKTNQWLLGKTCDSFSPVGPYLVTTNEVGNPNKLSLKTVVNAEVRQNSNTSDMIFSCEEIISYISHYMTLEPGDLILSGTPEGVILGDPKEERNYLKPGDIVTVEVENLGKLTNQFVEDL